MTVVESDHTKLSAKLSEQYKKVSNYMINSRLKLNDDKTHLMVICSSNARARSQSANLVQLTTITDIIKPSLNEKLLGCNIQNDLKWTNHIRENEDNMYKTLNKRVDAIRRISYSCDFKTRKMLANGLFMSKVIYLITIWGSCTKDLMDSIQVIQNRVARVITRNDWMTSSEENLKQIGWLSIYQLSVYFTIIQLHKVKQDKSPEKLYSMYNWNYAHNTRQEANQIVKPRGTPGLELTNNSFRWRASRLYNKLPRSIIHIEQLDNFKKNVKSWIMDNITLRR